MALGTLWIFGDSFDYGAEVSSYGFEYYRDYRKPGQYHYSRHLAQDLKLDLLNYAKPGFGPPHTIYYLSQHIHKIKPEDYVVVGMSDMQRLLGFVKDSTENFEHLLDVNGIWDNSRPDRVETFSYLDPKYTQHVENFTTVCREPFFGEITKLYFDTVHGMLKSIDCKKTFVYDMDFWFRFEHIRAATNGKIDDTHWSFKGNRDAADAILNLWEEEDNPRVRSIRQKKFNPNIYTVVKWMYDNPVENPYDLWLNDSDIKEDYSKLI